MGLLMARIASNAPTPASAAAPPATPAKPGPGPEPLPDGPDAPPGHAAWAQAAGTGLFDQLELASAGMHMPFLSPSLRGAEPGTAARFLAHEEYLASRSPMGPALEFNLEGPLPSPGRPLAAGSPDLGGIIIGGFSCSNHVELHVHHGAPPPSPSGPPPPCLAGGRA